MTDALTTREAIAFRAERARQEQAAGPRLVLPSAPPPASEEDYGEVRAPSAPIDDAAPSATGNGADKTEPLPKLVPIPYIPGDTIAPQEWLEPWIPMEGQTTLFQGDGGDGKTTIAQQLQSSCGTALPWLGLRVMECDSVGFYTEDRKKDLLRRQAAIDAAYGQDCLSTGRINLFPRRDCDNELIVFTRAGAPEIRPFFWQVREAALDLHAKLVVLDVNVDLFGGEENIRRQVRAFANLLNRELAGAIDGAVFLTGHLSQAGIRSDGGHSGSTDWSNAFRSRAYLARPKKDDGDEPADTNARLITRKKANFATIGETIKVHWERGLFLPETFTSNQFQSADDVFLALLDAVTAEGQNVSPKKKAGNCASALFMTRSPKERGGYQRVDFDRAMQTLLKDRKIKIIPYGPPSSGYQKLVRINDEGAP
jgi:hypothetical protein